MQPVAAGQAQKEADGKADEEVQLEREVVLVDEGAENHRAGFVAPVYSFAITRQMLRQRRERQRNAGRESDPRQALEGVLIDGEVARDRVDEKHRKELHEQVLGGRRRHREPQPGRALRHARLDLTGQELGRLGNESRGSTPPRSATETGRTSRVTEQVEER